MPSNSITSVIANEFAEATPGMFTSALMELGLLLFVITFIVLVLTKIIIRQLSRSEGEA